MCEREIEDIIMRVSDDEFTERKERDIIMRVCRVCSVFACVCERERDRRYTNESV